MKKAFILLFAVIAFILIFHEPIMGNIPLNESTEASSSAGEISLSEDSENNKESSVILTPTATPAPSALPEPTPTPEVFDPYKTISTMSDEELVGQLFLARCPELKDAKEKADKYHLGGYVLFGNHTKNETKESLSEYIADIQRDLPIPMFIAVDEEGGSVTRLSRYSQYRSENFPSPRYLYNKGGMDLILATEKEKCALLKELGFNLNLAPVCDITTDKNAFMYSRSLGESPEITAEYIKETVLLYESENLGAALKHFPGYGNNRDTHTGIAVDNKTLDELITKDLVPFFSGIKNGAQAILVSHTFINSLDENLPATLSPEVIGFLRNEMNFDGVIITDDLYMQAITDLYGASESALMAIDAGCDLLCSTEFEIQYEAVLNALKEGRIKRRCLEESAARVLIWKHKLGLIN